MCLRVFWPKRNTLEHCYVVETGKRLGFIVLGSLVHLGGRYVDFQNITNNKRPEGTRKILEMEESEKRGCPSEINMRREKGGS